MSDEPEKISWCTWSYLALGALGLVLRVVLSAFAYGTNDVTSWMSFAQAIHEAGLSELYRTTPLFNHPPLAGLLVTQLWHVAAHNEQVFPFLLRLPAILAECASAVLVWRISVARFNRQVAARAVAAFGTSLVAILISGYHGNTDSLYAFGLLLALWLFALRDRPGWAGAALGLACNIKIIPLLFVPAFLSQLRDRATTQRFLIGLGAALVPIFVMLAMSGASFVSNVLQYNSMRDYWGVQLVLLLLHANLPPQLAPWAAEASSLYSEFGRYLLLAALGGLALWYRRADRGDLFELCALTAVLFAVLAPGFGGQYFALFPPLLAVVSVPWAVRISLVAGLLQLSSYLHFLISIAPLRSEHTASAPKLTVFLAAVCWILMVVFLLERLTNRRIL